MPPSMLTRLSGYPTVTRSNKLYSLDNIAFVTSSSIIKTAILIPVPNDTLRDQSQIQSCRSCHPPHYCLILLDPWHSPFVADCVTAASVNTATLPATDSQSADFSNPDKTLSSSFLEADFFSTIATPSSSNPSTNVSLWAFGSYIKPIITHHRQHCRPSSDSLNPHHC